MYIKTCKLIIKLFVLCIFQSLPECRNLLLTNHMLAPIQRIPRYKMLFEEYLKKLPEDSSDRPDSEGRYYFLASSKSYKVET